jgi:hypothetical protein
MSYTFFWVILRRVNFTLSPCHSPSYWLRLFYSQTFSRINTPKFLKTSHSLYLPAYEDGTECSETSAYKIQTPGNYPEESIQYFYIIKWSKESCEICVAGYGLDDRISVSRRTFLIYLTNQTNKQTNKQTNNQSANHQNDQLTNQLTE